MTQRARNSFRIIAGDWRGRVLRFPDAPNLRPTADRVRETLFNWLQGAIAGAACLDPFAGSGALVLEALSRGAASLTALELDRAAAHALRRNGAALGARGLEVIQADALAWLRRGASRRYDVAFLDPPFAADRLEECCALLEEKGWLAEGALVYLEAGRPLAGLALPGSWELIREKRAGQVYFGLARRV